MEQQTSTHFTVWAYHPQQRVDLRKFETGYVHVIPEEDRVAFGQSTPESRARWKDLIDNGPLSKARGTIYIHYQAPLALTTYVGYKTRTAFVVVESELARFDAEMYEYNIRNPAQPENLEKEEDVSIWVTLQGHECPDKGIPRDLQFIWGGPGVFVTKENWESVSMELIRFLDGVVVGHPGMGKLSLYQTGPDMAATLIGRLARPFFRFDIVLTERNKDNSYSDWYLIPRGSQ